MKEPITMAKLELEGFRAYLRYQAFDLHDEKNGPLSLAVFAPNGRGKSSMVDALEYYFRKDGSLERLGQKSSGNKAGIGAIRHVYAERRGVETYVSAQFKRGDEMFGGRRPFSTPLTDDAKHILRHIKVPFVVRGYELRRFVEDTSPMARYGDLVAWLDLNPLLDVQKGMKKLKGLLKKEIDDEKEGDMRLRDLAKITEGAIREWDEGAILKWFNEHILAPLDASIRFNALSDEDAALRELKSRKQAELERAGLDVQRKLLDAIWALLGRQVTLHGELAGQIHLFESAVSAFKDAAAVESAARSAASESVFIEVWESAKKLLEGDSKFDMCPVCGMELAKSPSGSRDGAHATISCSLNKLEGYLKAEAAKESAKAHLSKAARDVGESLDNILLLVDSMHEYDAVVAYRQNLKSWRAGEGAPDSDAAIQTLKNLRSSVSVDIEQMDRQRGGITYNNAHEKVCSLLYVKAELERIGRTKEELRAILGSLGGQIKAFNIAIVGHIQGLVGRLIDDAGAIYEDIQGPGEAPRIQIKLAREGDARQRNAKLLINFADQKNVAPSGYLSDSQVHTLALAVRLAAIRLFNAGFRVMALDDIVTSYDADHRKKIAAVLNERFGEFQIILATHDKQFFNTLNDHFGKKRWVYKRIKEFQTETGPIFEDHRTRDEDIEAKIKAGEDAVIDIRKAEEKWLSRICNEFTTPVAFRLNRKPNRSEMAQSLERFLEKRGLESPTIPGYSRPFLRSLQEGSIENAGSHYGCDPYVNLSHGDVRARWEEFKAFRDIFKCPKCRGSRLKIPRGQKKLACKSCGVQFDLGRKAPT